MPLSLAILLMMLILSPEKRKQETSKEQATFTGRMKSKIVIFSLINFFIKVKILLLSVIIFLAPFRRYTVRIYVVNQL
jgi:hypothetical protein